MIYLIQCLIQCSGASLWITSFNSINSTFIHAIWWITVTSSLLLSFSICAWTTSKPKLQKVLSINLLQALWCLLWQVFFFFSLQATRASHCPFKCFFWHCIWNLQYPYLWCWQIWSSMIWYRGPGELKNRQSLSLLTRVTPVYSWRSQILVLNTLLLGFYISAQPPYIVTAACNPRWGDIHSLPGLASWPCYS